MLFDRKTYWLVFGLSIFSIGMCPSQTLTGTDGGIEEFIWGYIYTLNANPHTDTPVTSTNPMDTLYGPLSWGTPMQFVLIGEPGSSFQVQFELPDSFVGGYCPRKTLHCSF